MVGGVAVLALGVASDGALIKGCETQPVTGKGEGMGWGHGAGADGRYACLNFAGHVKCQDCFGH